MRLLTYEREGTWAPGLAIDGRVVDTSDAAATAGLMSSGDARWSTNRAVLELTPIERDALAKAAQSLAVDEQRSHEHGALRLGAPVTDPEKIVCLGLNYRAHAAETGFEQPAAPMLFAKFRNALTGHDNPIRVPPVASLVDYEGELAVVIGRRCQAVAPGHAPKYIAGAMVFNDVSARDLQFRTSQWLAGKTLDTFAPCGPELVLRDEIDDLERLAITTRLNGETMQSANTAEMIFSVTEIVAFVSRLMTLEPGDIIATGTPAGVGYTRNPPVALGHGDVVEIEIEGIGLLRNHVIVDPAQNALAPSPI